MQSAATTTDTPHKTPSDSGVMALTATQNTIKQYSHGSYYHKTSHNTRPSIIITKLHAKKHTIKQYSRLSSQNFTQKTPSNSAVDYHHKTAHKTPSNNAAVAVTITKRHTKHHQRVQ